MYKIYTTRRDMGRPEYHIVKSLVITVLLITFLLCAGVASAQTITANFKNTPLKTVIRELKKQTHYDFLISARLLDEEPPVNLNVRNAELKTTLDILFKDSPLTYVIQDKTVVIRKKSTQSQEPPASGSLFVNGGVYDAEKRPLAGATVMIKGTNIYTTTSANGYFNIRVPDGDAVLKVSFMGYTPQELPAKSYMGQIVLTIAESVLDEVQVRTYGQTTNRLSTGDGKTIGAKELAQSRAPNILSALAGRVPGLTIIQNGSNASANYSVLIRGNSSLGTNVLDNLNYRNQPLFILDGFPLAQGTDQTDVNGNIRTGMFQAIDPSNGNNTTPTGAGLSVLYSINPADVESVTVLKDAEATAIYGSRGANGVILITTKKAKPGRLNINGNVEYGYSSQAKKLNLMNTQQYLAMRSQAITNDSTYYTGSATLDYNRHNPGNFPDYYLMDRNRNVDWQKELLGAKPTITTNLGFNSGTELTSIRSNFSYFKNLANLPNAASSLANNYNESRVTGSLAILARSTNNRFRLNSALNLNSAASNLPSTMLESLVFLAPNAPDLFTPQGDLNFAGWRVVPTSNTNGTLVNTLPVAAMSLLKPYKMNSTGTNANLDMQYDIANGLTVDVKGSYSISNMDQYQVTQNAATTAPEDYSKLNRSASFSFQKLSTWTTEGALSYSRIFGKHHISATAGGSYQVNNQNLNIELASGFVADELMTSTSAATSIQGGSNLSQSKLMSGYALLGYNYDNRYILNVSGRRDGSSDFSYNTYGNYGSVSGAWLFSDEPWLKFLRTDNIFSFGKLRGSLGRSGSPVNIPNLALNNYTSVSAGTFSETYQGIKLLSSFRPANTNLLSPVKTSSEFGMDLGFFSDHLTLSVSHYLSRTSNMIINEPVVAAVGFSSVPYNIPGIVKSYGWEGDIMYRSTLKNDFTYSIGLNISNGDNILESFNNLATSPFSKRYAVGESINRTLVYKLSGIDNKDLYTYPLPYAGATGPDFYYVSSAPKYSGGMQLNLSYKSWSLGTNWTFQRKLGFYGLAAAAVPGNFNVGLGNQSADIAGQVWQKPGDESSVIYQRYTTSGASMITGANVYYQSNLFLQDIKYIGLKNARVEYRFPKKWMTRMKINNISMYVAGDNLFYITNYKGLNPENSSSNLLIMRRNVNLGLNIQL